MNPINDQRPTTSKKSARGAARSLTVLRAVSKRSKARSLTVLKRSLSVLKIADGGSSIVRHRQPKRLVSLTLRQWLYGKLPPQKASKNVARPTPPRALPRCPLVRYNQPDLRQAAVTKISLYKGFFHEDRHHRHQPRHHQAETARRQSA